MGRTRASVPKYYGTSLDQVFVHSDYQRIWFSKSSNFNSENYLQVKIIKEVSPTEYIVADATGFRHIYLEIELHDISSEIYWRPNKMLLKENNYVKIQGYGIDFESKKVILKQKTIITKIEEFPVDQTKPASNVSTTVVVNFEKNLRIFCLLILSEFLIKKIFSDQKCQAFNRATCLYLT